MLELYLKVYFVIFIFFVLFYFVSIYLKDSSIVDSGWGSGFFVATLAAIVITQNFTTGSIIALILTAMWGFRLTFFIFIRNKDKGEDYRYAKWRKEWGKTFYIRSFFQVFVLQSIIQAIVAIPLIYIVYYSKNNLIMLSYIGILVFLIGLIIESISDYQKYVFKEKNPKGIMKKGLYKYSRHPNYFGDSLVWFGIAIFSLTFKSTVVVFISPVIMTFLLLFVSGIPLIEKKYKDNKEFQEYKKNTSPFIPWFSKKK